MELMLYVAGLRGLCSKKLLPRWQVIKEGADFDLSTGSVSPIAYRFDLSSVHEHLGPSNCTMLSC